MKRKFEDDEDHNHQKGEKRPRTEPSADFVEVSDDQSSSQSEASQRNVQSESQRKACSDIVMYKSDMPDQSSSQVSQRSELQVNHSGSQVYQRSVMIDQSIL